MSGFIGEEIIREIQERVDIVQIVSQYVLLKKTGTNFKGLCPFHPEKTPSFTVSPEKQIFHCFGCGAGGNVFHFLMKHENMSFPEVVKHFAQKVGIALPETGKENSLDILKEELFRINRLVADYFHQQLLHSPGGEKAKRYLKKREFNIDSAIKFKIGFSLEEWNSLGGYLISRGISYSLMEKAGFVVPRNDGKGFYDRFRGRLMFPIYNSWGEVLAFGGRILSDSTEHGPKYMNSPETIIYKKSKNLYGLNWAKDHIRKENKAIIVEGYLDLIRVVEAGFVNVVATLGTALTREQAQLLKGLTEEVILVYDGDLAGKKAIDRGQELLMEASLHVKVVQLPDGQDPDSIIRKRGSEAFLAELNKAKLYPLYFMDQVLAHHNLTLIEDRVNIVQKVIPVLSKIPSYTERADYTKLLAEKVGLPEEAINAELHKTGALTKFARNQGSQDKTKILKSMEFQLCQIILLRPELLRSLDNDPLFNKEGFFQEKNIEEIVETIRFFLKKNMSATGAEIVVALPNDEARNLASQMLLEKLAYENPEAVVHDFLNFARKNELQECLRTMSTQIKEAESGGELNKLRDLQKEYQKIKVDLAHLS